MVHRKVLGCVLALAVVCPAAACTASVDVGSAGAGSDAGSSSSSQAASEAASELSIGQNTFAPGEVTPSTGTGVMPGQDLMSVPCHPELFARSVEYAEVLNYHVNMFLRDVEAMLQGTASVSGDSVTWTYEGHDADVQLKLTQTRPDVYGVTLAVAASGSHAFVTIVTGSIDRSMPLDVTKQLGFDLDALHKVVPAVAGDHSRGQLAVSIERMKNSQGSELKRFVTYTLAGFEPVYGDPQGPRSGTVLLLDEPGVGGSMLYDASSVFFCPANPQDLAADATTYVRWVVQGQTVFGRADAIATGGQLTSGDRWLGLSCRSYSSDVESGFKTDDGYWLMKEENASGATVVGLQTAVQDTVGTDSPCSPAFGAVTDLNDDTNDPVLPGSLVPDAFPGEF
jgi:hypothetical protein